MNPISGFLISTDKDEWPKQLAELFCGLHADQQAAFFNEVAVISGAWDGPSEIQWRSMQEYLSVGGKRVVDEISEHTSDEDDTPPQVPDAMVEGALAAWYPGEWPDDDCFKAVNPDGTTFADNSRCEMRKTLGAALAAQSREAVP